MNQNRYKIKDLKRSIVYNQDQIITSSPCRVKINRTIAIFNYMTFFTLQLANILNSLGTNGIGAFHITNMALSKKEVL